MPNYIRAYVPGGSYFFTVALLEGRRHLLTEHIDALRIAFTSVRRQRPFRIDAIVVLPDHLHGLSTLPPDDADYNPVKHGYVARVADWPYSSLHHFVENGVYRNPIWVVETGKIPPPLTRLPPFEKGGLGGFPTRRDHNSFRNPISARLGGRSRNH